MHGSRQASRIRSHDRGGFPNGSLITLAVAPGREDDFRLPVPVPRRSRKATRMYVSMLEGRRAYLRNMARLGLDVPRSRRRALPLPRDAHAYRGGLPAIWEEIVRNIDELEIVRLVIDSFTAMSQAFDNQGHACLHPYAPRKDHRKFGCTTLMITETPPGTRTRAPGCRSSSRRRRPLLPRPRRGDARIRYIEITKMRGTSHQMGRSRSTSVATGHGPSPHIPGRA